MTRIESEKDLRDWIAYWHENVWGMLDEWENNDTEALLRYAEKLLDELDALRERCETAERAAAPFAPPIRNGTRVRLKRAWRCNYLQSDLSHLRVDHPVGTEGIVSEGRLTLYDTWKTEFEYRIEFANRSDDIGDEYLEVVDNA